VIKSKIKTISKKIEENKKKIWITFSNLLEIK
jgi:hypothetical protein